MLIAAPIQIVFKGLLVLGPRCTAHKSLANKKNGLDTTQERAAFEDYQYRKRIAIDYKIELHRMAVEKALRDLQKIHALYKQ